MIEIPFFTTRAAFAMRVGQLSSLLYEQMEEGLVSRGIRLRGYATSIVQTLHHAGPRSITEIADGLQLSHQLASQRVKWLVGEGFATIERSSEDRRRRIVALTVEGSAEAEKLQEFLPVLATAYSDIFDEIGVDVHQATLDVTEALARRSLALRCKPSRHPQGVPPQFDNRLEG